MTADHVSRMGHPASFVTPSSSPPIYQTTAFDVPDLDVLEAMHAGQVNGYIYTRDNNPNHAALAATIAELEAAEAAATFSSGMGAIAAVVMSLVKTGQHILMSQVLYGQTMQLAKRLRDSYGVRLSVFDPANPASLQQALQKDTALCLVETVANPLLEVADLSALADAAGDVPLIVDSTFTTPELIRPLEHGAIAVVHSASKYLNGHGDVMLGVAAGSAQLMKAALQTASIFGQNANPFECWLTQRGLRTLPLRMRQICQSATALAQFLESRPEVARVHHPTLRTHSTHSVATRLYPHGTGGIVSFELRDGNRDRVSAFMQAATSIPFSPTLADARTTVSHPASTSHRYMSPDERQAIGIRDGLVRLSVGLEPIDMLQSELARALEAVHKS
jgi:cystathionine beta-lyase/cystathionine gamma-synthase